MECEVKVCGIQIRNLLWGDMKLPMNMGIHYFPDSILSLDWYMQTYFMSYHNSFPCMTFQIYLKMQFHGFFSKIILHVFIYGTK